ncbi:hypothetical protein MPH_09211 [Macrophomina phaseolina MS6]|uniref:Uncharacterized protein n=1 Tax=Macrophomina phaseolina (strain MS6) TaxID=1126212 RepID=K2RTY4_MACPH|nr:hypothetical protein MPH_09211 [Macrophomina phaseolina MS6]
MNKTAQRNNQAMGITKNIHFTLIYPRCYALGRCAPYLRKREVGQEQASLYDRPHPPQGDAHLHLAWRLVQGGRGRCRLPLQRIRSAGHPAKRLAPSPLSSTSSAPRGSAAAGFSKRRFRPSDPRPRAAARRPTSRASSSSASTVTIIDK